MTTEPRPDGVGPRRKFDDVASLFGSVGPGGPGASRFPPHRPAFIPMPPTYTAPVKHPDPAPSAAASPSAAPPPDKAGFGDQAREASVTMADLMAMPPPPAPVPLPGRVAPPPVARQAPTEIPWPDAFEPRPNYRKPERNSWSWMLLIPAGLVAAAAITLVDARSVRNWIDTTILHRTPIAGGLDSPLLPKPFRTAPTTAPAADATPPQEDIPYPAIPTSPVPIPPGAEVSPPPPDVPATATATDAATPIHVTIQFRRNIPGADGEARRIAALLQSYGGSIELHPNATTVRAATINYYNAADKDAANGLAGVLSNEAATWIVKLGTTKNPPGTLDVWLP